MLGGREEVMAGTRGNDVILVVIHRDGGKLHSPAPETALQSRE